MLPRASRLKRSRDFQAVYKASRSYATPNLVLYVRSRRGPAGNALSEQARLGFVISKKVARRAHDRNRLKRRLREICRLSLLPRLRRDAVIDALFVARSAAPAVDYARLAADIDKLSRQAGLVL